MTIENKNLIEEIILFIKNKNGTISVREFNSFFEPDESIKDDFKSKNRDRLMINRLLIDDFGYLNRIGNHTFRLTETGWKFKSYKNIEEKENRKNKKEIFDFKVSKFKYHTFWYFFIIAIIGFGFSIFNFINSLSPSENTIKQEERIVKMESELKKLQISISNQKNLDSLHNSRVLKSIENTKKSKNK